MTKTKSAKVKLPKRIAGIKVPKELRKQGEALLTKANSPEGRQAIASGLAMVAGVAAANAAKRPAAAPEPKASETPRGSGDAQQVVDAIGAAAEAVMGRFFARR